MEHAFVKVEFLPGQFDTVTTSATNAGYDYTLNFPTGQIPGQVLGVSFQNNSASYCEQTAMPGGGGSSNVQHSYWGKMRIKIPMIRMKKSGGAWSAWQYKEYQLVAPLGNFAAMLGGTLVWDGAISSFRGYKQSGAFCPGGQTVNYQRGWMLGGLNNDVTVIATAGGWAS